MKIQFVHFELYYKVWHKTFKKATDPIMLFFHYCMIQNRFKHVKSQPIVDCDHDLSEMLPDDWNTTANAYKLPYSKHGYDYELHVTHEIKTNLLNFKLTRLKDSVNSTIQVNVSKYLLNANYGELTNYKTLYHNLNSLYLTFQSFLNYFKHASKTTKTKFGYFEIIHHIKQEKESYDSSIDVIREMHLNSKASKKANNEPKITKKTCLSQQELDCLDSKAVEILKSKGYPYSIQNLIQDAVSSDASATFGNDLQTTENVANNQNSTKSKKINKINHVYDYNPISDYTYYNNDINNADEERLEELKQEIEGVLSEARVNELFKQYGLQKVELKVPDCATEEFFSQVKSPIKLSAKTKEILRVNTFNSNLRSMINSLDNVSDKLRKRKITLDGYLNLNSSRLDTTINETTTKADRRSSKKIKIELIDSDDMNKSMNEKIGKKIQSTLTKFIKESSLTSINQEKLNETVSSSKLNNTLATPPLQCTKPNDDEEIEIVWSTSPKKPNKIYVDDKENKENEQTDSEVVRTPKRSSVTNKKTGQMNESLDLSWSLKLTTSPLYQTELAPIHQNNNYECPICQVCIDQESITLTLFQEHVDKCDTDKYNTCMFCLSVFDKSKEANEYSIHVNNHLS